MATYYISPYRRMRQLRNAFDRMFADELPTNGGTSVHIPLDVEVQDEAYVIRAYVPGLESDDVTIQVLDDTISIQGELKPSVDEEVKYLMKEIPSGEFRRVIRFPMALDPKKADAVIENGILSLHVPMAETARPKTIEVKAK